MASTIISENAGSSFPSFTSSPFFFYVFFLHLPLLLLPFLILIFHSFLSSLSLSNLFILAHFFFSFPLIAPLFSITFANCVASRTRLLINDKKLLKSRRANNKNDKEEQGVVKGRKGKAINLVSPRRVEIEAVYEEESLLR